MAGVLESWSPNHLTYSNKARHRPEPKYPIQSNQIKSHTEREVLSYPQSPSSKFIFAIPTTPPAGPLARNPGWPSQRGDRQWSLAEGRPECVDEYEWASIYTVGSSHAGLDK
jgi:hypothetical protein